MRNVAFIIMAYLVSMQICKAQTGNYVKTVTYLNNTKSDSISSVQYYDGLGRAYMSASSGVGGNGNYAYTLSEYDLAGREIKKWFPVTGGSSLSQPTVGDIASLSHSTYCDSRAFLTTKYDGSNRKVEIFPGGDVWESNAKVDSIDYSVNTDNQVNYYTVTSRGVELSGFWPKGSLTIEKAIDADNKTSITYKNMYRDVIMTDNAGAKTYYVYNNRGLLVYVLTPQYQESSDIDADAYKYEYDSYDRISSKSLPGCSHTDFIYDDKDRIVITQDPLLREKGLYRFMLYDNLGRLAIQGTTCSYDTTQINNSIATKATGGTGHSNTGYYFCQPLFPDGFDIEIINYYDDYAFFSHSMLSSTSFHDNLWNENYVSTNNSTSAFSKGSMTGQIVATSDGNMLYNVFYYDQKGRVIDERHTTLSNKVYKVLTDYSFTDKPISVTKVIPVTGGQLSFRPTSPGNATDTYTLTTKYTYNQYNDQLEAVWVEHDNDSTCVSQITYNNLGQIQSEMRPEISDAVSYEYDLHGWTKSIDSDYFKERLHYADGSDTGYFCYNGDISSQLWMNADTAVWRGYKFKYDDRDMLYQSSYGEGENLALNKGRYNENITEFNSNGGIVRLSRKGKNNSGSYGMIDNLIYDYDGNKVTGIRDRYPTLLSYNGAFEYRNTHTATAAEPDFEYNSAGMLIKDRDKGISRITYNNIGLVDSIFFDNGARIAYVYSMTGEKLKVAHWTAMASTASATIAGIGDVLTPTQPRNIKTTEYIGGDIEAESQSLIYGSAYKYHFGNGYVRFYPGSTQIPQYYYYTADHLGNIRSVVTKNHSTNEITEVQQTHYYPFGGIIADLSSDRDVQNRLYNGKELDTSNNLWWYDYGARQYDPTAPRFTTPDPLAEKYYPWNYYAYCMNNPVKNIDPDGRFPAQIAAGIIGGFAGAGVYAFTAYVGGKSSDEIWGAAAEGFIVGGITGLTLGTTTSITVGTTLGEMAISGVSSGLGNSANQLISSGEVEVNESLCSTLSGGVCGGVGSVAGKIVNSVGKSASCAVSQNADDICRGARDAAKTQVKQSGTNVFGKSAKQQVNRAEKQIVKNARNSEKAEKQVIGSITKGGNWSVQMVAGAASERITKACYTAKKTIQSLLKRLF